MEGESLPLIVFAGVGCQVYRYVRVSTQSERQQTKWVLVGFGGMVIWLLLWFLVVEPAILALPDSSIRYTLYLSIGSAVILPLPLSIALSILRYRLWDIDLLIRRTLVYGALTATLGLLYLVTVVLLQQLFRAFTCQGLGLGGVGSSPLVIAIFTSIIAALFNPLRRRIENDIDRHFYLGQVRCPASPGLLCRLCPRRDRVGAASGRAGARRRRYRTTSPPLDMAARIWDNR